MEARKIGDALIFIELDEDHPDTLSGERATYKGQVVVDEHVWEFDDLGAPKFWDKSWDSDEAFDEMAGSAVSFGGYYTTHNRGDDPPDWAPDEETADAIDEAVSWAQDGGGNYEVETILVENPRLTSSLRGRIRASKFALPRLRKLPIQDANHVRNAMARFDQVKGVTSAQMDNAYRRIVSAAHRYGIDPSGFMEKYG